MGSIKEYDKEMQTYNDLRQSHNPLDFFSKQVVGVLQNPQEKGAKMLSVIRDQGFDLQLRLNMVK